MKWVATAIAWLDYAGQILQTIAKALDVVRLHWPVMPGRGANGGHNQEQPQTINSAEVKGGGL